MPQYKVRTACEVAGRWRNANEIIEMTEEQARHLVAPFGGVLVAVAPVVAVVTQPAPAMTIREPEHGLQHRNKRDDRRSAKRLGARQAVDTKDTDDAFGQSSDEA